MLQTGQTTEGQPLILLDKTTVHEGHCTVFSSSMSSLGFTRNSHNIYNGCN